MTFQGRAYGLGALLVVVALIVTVVLVVTKQLEFMWLGAVLLLIEAGILVP